jgi:hypothetical protein
VGRYVVNLVGRYVVELYNEEGAHSAIGNRTPVGRTDSSAIKKLLADNLDSDGWQFTRRRGGTADHFAPSLSRSG